jgi:hypothetical protein
LKPGWVAGSVRARLLADRRLADAGARAVAAAGEMRAAVALVAASPYGRDVDAGMDLVTAERGVRATALWHLRVLAGWLPPGGSDVVRMLAGGHEIANVEAHVAELAGAPHIVPFDLGALGTAWPRVRAARSISEVRAALAQSPWGDPGSSLAAPFGAALRIAWARRITERIPELGQWASAAAAIVIAGERFGNGQDLTATAAIDAGRLLGPRWDVGDLGSFIRAVPADVRWVFADVSDDGELWRAETAWWRRLRSEAARQTRRATKGEATVTWSTVLLLADAHHVCAALEAAAWGLAGLEEFDAVA